MEIWFFISLEELFENVLKKKSNLCNLIEVDPLDKNIRKNPDSVDIGFTAHKIQFKFCKTFVVQETSWIIFSAASAPPSRKVTIQICSCELCCISKHNVHYKSY